MSKWKCEICNSSFENFGARGFDNKIYCPLCYYKKLYKDTELERERLNNIIEKLEQENAVADYDEQMIEIIMLKEKIDKAIEYIKEHTNLYTSYLGKEPKVVPKLELQREVYDKLLDILKGVDKN